MKTPAKIIGKKNSEFSIIFNIANGIHTERLLLRQRNVTVIKNVIFIRL